MLFTLVIAHQRIRHARATDARAETRVTPQLREGVGAPTVPWTRAGVRARVVDVI